MIITAAIGCCLALCAVFAWSGNGARAPNELTKNEADNAFSDDIPLLSAKELVTRARRLKTSHDRRERLATSSGKDLSRYFMPNADTALNRRLRRAGIRPDEVDLPPAIAGLEEEILAPPQEASDRNDGFFERNNRR